MFGLGLGETILILIGILLFIKPKDIPDTLKKVKSFIQKIQTTMNSTKKALSFDDTSEKKKQTSKKRKFGPQKRTLSSNKEQ